MLYSIDSNKYITNIPHEKDYNRWMKDLSQNDHERIKEELNNRIKGNELATSSWIPGSDWTGTVFAPIYIACRCNPVTSAMFFGLILFDVMLQRDDVWGFGRYEVDGRKIKGMTYFLLENPPQR